mmetsp:Transcript_22953/g.71350  ORF Transcript_22953/g.71350 Transcript_22953/m.71350 type:complete len:412 (+) Transcript_22953:650-1885(+)
MGLPRDHGSEAHARLLLGCLGLRAARAAALGNAGDSPASSATLIAFQYVGPSRACTWSCAKTSRVCGVAEGWTSSRISACASATAALPSRRNAFISSSSTTRRSRASLRRRASSSSDWSSPTSLACRARTPAGTRASSLPPPWSRAASLREASMLGWPLACCFVARVRASLSAAWSISILRASCPSRSSASPCARASSLACTLRACAIASARFASAAASASWRSASKASSRAAISARSPSTAASARCSRSKSTSLYFALRSRTTSSSCARAAARSSSWRRRSSSACTRATARWLWRMFCRLSTSVLDWRSAATAWSWRCCRSSCISRTYCAISAGVANAALGRPTSRRCLAEGEKCSSHWRRSSFTLAAILVFSWSHASRAESWIMISRDIWKRYRAAGDVAAYLPPHLSS